jgi:hypothetical protein
MVGNEKHLREVAHSDLQNVKLEALLLLFILLLHSFFLTLYHFLFFLLFSLFVSFQIIKAQFLLRNCVGYSDVIVRKRVASLLLKM